MSWFKDITAWAKKNNKDPKIVEKIVIRKGWEPTKYLSSMRDNLHSYLDQWYTLSIKALPTPATNNRKNPVPLSLMVIPHDVLEQYESSNYRKACQIEEHLIRRSQ